MRLFARPQTALLVFAILFLVLAQPAFAAIDEQGVQKLEKLFDDLLTQYSDAAAAKDAALVAEGPVLVEPSDSYYAVTMPHLTLRHEDGAYTEIGMPAFNVIPGEKEGLWKMTLAIPSPITHYSPDGTATVTANINSQNFAGIWHEKFKNFIMINAHYKDITIEQHKDQTRLVIPEMKWVSDLKEDENGLWSGPARFKLTDFQMFFEQSGATANIDEVVVSSQLDQYSLDAALRYQEQMQALAESYESGDVPSASAPHVLGLYNMISGFLGQSMNGFSFDVGVKDFVLTRPPMPPAPAGHIKLDDIRFSFDIAGLHAGSVSIGLKTGYDGFFMQPVADDYNQATPAFVNIDLRVNKLPYKEIIDLGRRSIETAMQDAPEAGKFAGLQALTLLPQLLTAAKTNLTVRDTVVGNEHYKITTNGIMTADINAAMGATGSVRSEIIGLDTLIAALKKAEKNPEIDEKKKKNIQNTLSTLALIQMVGQSEKNEAGQDVRIYNIELTPQGEALLNGTDLQAILQTKKDKP